MFHFSLRFLFLLFIILLFFFWISNTNIIFFFFRFEILNIFLTFRMFLTMNQWKPLAVWKRSSFFKCFPFTRKCQTRLRSEDNFVFIKFYILFSIRFLSSLLRFSHQICTNKFYSLNEDVIQFLLFCFSARVNTVYFHTTAIRFQINWVSFWLVEEYRAKFWIFLTI